METSISLPPISDLPPRTWHGWWLAWPKWFRIGCWAAAGLAVLHILLAVRIPLGLIESDDIQQLRKRGAQITYHHTCFFNCRHTDLYFLIEEGLVGRSARNVMRIQLNNLSEADFNFPWAAKYPRLKRMILTRTAQDPPFHRLPRCYEDKRYWVDDAPGYVRSIHIIVDE